MLSKTYMQGMSDFLNALHDPQGEGKPITATSWWPRWRCRRAPPRWPAIQRSLARQHYGLLSGIQARTPGLSSSLPPVRDLWGQPVPQSKGFLPIDSGTHGEPVVAGAMGPAGNAQPIDKWIWDNRAAFPDADNGRLGLTRPGQVQSFDVGQVSAQTQADEKQLDRLRELAGNGSRIPHRPGRARRAECAGGRAISRSGNAQAQWDKASRRRGGDGAAHLERYRDAAKRLLAESPDCRRRCRKNQQPRRRRCARPIWRSAHDDFRRLCAQHRSGQWRHHRLSR
jgi:hypothetical protein